MQNLKLVKIKNAQEQIFAPNSEQISFIMTEKSFFSQNQILLIGCQVILGREVNLESKSIQLTNKEGEYLDKFTKGLSITQLPSINQHKKLELIIQYFKHKLDDYFVIDFETIKQNKSTSKYFLYHKDLKKTIKPQIKSFRIKMIDLNDIASDTQPQIMPKEKYKFANTILRIQLQIGPNYPIAHQIINSQVIIYGLAHFVQPFIHNIIDYLTSKLCYLQIEKETLGIKVLKQQLREESQVIIHREKSWMINQDQKPNKFWLNRRKIIFSTKLKFIKINDVSFILYVNQFEVQLQKYMKQYEAQIHLEKIQNYTKKLQKDEARKFEVFLTNHQGILFVQQSKKWIGSKKVISELNFLIDSKQKPKTKMLEEKEKNKPIDKIVFRKIKQLSGILINSQNYREYISNLISLKCINSTIIQITTKQSIIIYNRCRSTLKMFVVFCEFYELIELQALIDREWNLFTMTEIIKHFEDSTVRMKLINHPDYQIYFFRRTDPEDWDKFIVQINKRSAYSNMIVTKAKYFRELQAKRELFTSTISVTLHEDQISIPFAEIQQLKTFQSECSILRLKDLVEVILKKNYQDYKYNGILLDCLTSFNICQIKDQFKQKDGQIFLILKCPDQESEEYVYFVYFKKLFLIIRENSQIRLKECELKTQISDYHFLKGLQNVRKWAIINRISFIHVSRKAAGIERVYCHKIKKVNNSSYNLLTYYKYKINELRYEVQFKSECNETKFMSDYEPVYDLAFTQSNMHNKVAYLCPISKNVLKYQKDSIFGFKAPQSICNKFIQNCLKQTSNHEIQEKPKSSKYTKVGKVAVKI